MTRPLRVANCSGFLGDRLSAAREMIDGGPIDVLTGDWLAELTMGVLLKQRAKRPEAGYARSFLTQMEDVLGDCSDRGIKVVSNAGGLNPRNCARNLEFIAGRLGRTVKVAVVDGDDVTALVRDDLAAGWPAPHLDTEEPFTRLGSQLEFASAYLGCWGIVEALERGADVVITGRVSDASVVVGPAAWHHGWRRDDWNALAGAVAAAHVIECGAQATGGNFSFFEELGGLERPGFPIAEIESNGSAIITKHPGTGGAVTTETVTAQLLYEINGPRYLNPDVIARFDTLNLTQEGTDRVRIDGVVGEPAPTSTKVGLLTTAGYRNTVSFVLTGGNIQAKAELAQRALWSAVSGGKSAFDEVDVRLRAACAPDAAIPNDATSLLTVSVKGRDRQTVDDFSRAAVETGLSSYPGLYLTEPPGPGSAYTVFWPTLVCAARLTQRVQLAGEQWSVAVAGPGGAVATVKPIVGRPARDRAEGLTARVALGHVLGARSGDKGGNATLGVWARDDAGFDWLASWLTDERWRELLPQAEGLELRPWWLPRLRAAGVTVVGLLGRGVAANLALDSQAKGLAEYLRARPVDLPIALLAAPHTVTG